MIEAVRAHLRSARDAAGRRRSLRRRVVDWWQGTSIEHGYRSLHAARVALVELLTPDQLRQLVPATVARVTTHLPPLDARRVAVEKLPEVQDPRVLCPAIQHGLAVSYDAADQVHQRVRTFRNILLSAAALITALMAVFVVVVAFWPTSIPFCFRPGVVAPTATGTSVVLPAGPQGPPFVCPSGDTPAPTPQGGPDAATARQPVHPSPSDVLIIAGLGVIGGALASAVNIRKVSGAATPYSVPTALAVLKVPTGALTAVSAILLLGGVSYRGSASSTASRRSSPTRTCSATPSSSRPASWTTAPAPCSRRCRASSRSRARPPSPPGPRPAPPVRSPASTEAHACHVPARHARGTATDTDHPPEGPMSRAAEPTSAPSSPRRQPT